MFTVAAKHTYRRTLYSVRFFCFVFTKYGLQQQQNGRFLFRNCATRGGLIHCRQQCVFIVVTTIQIGLPRVVPVITSVITNQSLMFRLCMPCVYTVRASAPPAHTLAAPPVQHYHRHVSLRTYEYVCN